MKWIATHIFDVIAGVVLVLFVGTWLMLLVQTWTFDPTDETPKLVLNSAVVIVAGGFATALGAQTSAALGFAIVEVKIAQAFGIDDVTVPKGLTAMTYIAILTYLAVGLAVFFTWLFDPESSPETVTAFAISIFGWMLGAAGVAFKPVDQKLVGALVSR